MPLAWTVQRAELTHARRARPGWPPPASSAGSARPPRWPSRPPSSSPTATWPTGSAGGRSPRSATGSGWSAPRCPAASVSEELRAYPGDLLTDPLDVRSATLQVRAGHRAAAGPGPALPTVLGDRAAGSAQLDAWFTGLVGQDDLTAGVGLLAVLLAVVLGASHAMLPGHGKTVMAAYLAGRRGTRRDALLVGATVTATHTAGVLVLGLVISVSADAGAGRAC